MESERPAEASLADSAPWRLHSWDKFALPRPWSLGTAVTTEPITVPPDADDDELEHYRLRVEAALEWATINAQRWADNGGRGRSRTALAA